MSSSSKMMKQMHRDGYVLYHADDARVGVNKNLSFPKIHVQYKTSYNLCKFISSVDTFFLLQRPNQISNNLLKLVVGGLSFRVSNIDYTTTGFVHCKLYRDMI